MVDLSWMRIVRRLALLSFSAVPGVIVRAGVLSDCGGGP